MKRKQKHETETVCEEVPDKASRLWIGGGDDLGAACIECKLARKRKTNL